MLIGTKQSLNQKRKCANVYLGLWVENFCLWEEWRDTNVKSDVVFVNEIAGFFVDLCHDLQTRRWKWVSVVLTDVARVVADGGENFVGWVWYESMRPHKLCPRIEVRRIFQNRIPQLITTSISRVFLFKKTKKKNRNKNKQPLQYHSFLAFKRKSILWIWFVHSQQFLWD